MQIVANHVPMNQTWRHMDVNVMFVYSLEANLIEMFLTSDSRSSTEISLLSDLTIKKCPSHTCHSVEAYSSTCR
jgi:hypothetical protein